MSLCCFVGVERVALLLRFVKYGMARAVGTARMFLCIGASCSSYVGARAASLAASYRMWSRMWNVAPLVVIHVFRVVKYCCFCLRVSKAFSKRKVESVLAFLVVEYQIFMRTVLLYVSVESVFQVKVFPLFSLT